VPASDRETGEPATEHKRQAVNREKAKLINNFHLAPPSDDFQEVTNEHIESSIEEKRLESLRKASHNLIIDEAKPLYYFDIKPKELD